jgi:phage/plasmid-associated DNA primase
MTTKPISFGPQDEAEINILPMLKDHKVSEAEKRGGLVEEIMHRYHIATIEATKEMFWCDAGVYVPGAEQKILAELDTLGGFLIDNHMRSEVISTIRAKTFKPRSDFDRDLNVVNLKNGLPDIETGKFTEGHDGNYLSTIQLPIYYDKNARCPNIIKFLTSTLDNEYLGTVIRLFGYVLYRKSIYHKAFMLTGAGSNGKSTFIDLLTAFIGRTTLAIFHSKI